jgi:hypothetical protein
MRCSADSLRRCFKPRGAASGRWRDRADFLGPHRRDAGATLASYCHHIEHRRNRIKRRLKKAVAGRVIGVRFLIGHGVGHGGDGGADDMGLTAACGHWRASRQWHPLGQAAGGSRAGEPPVAAVR